MLLLILRQMPHRLSAPQDGKKPETKPTVNPLRNRYVLLIFVMFIISISSNYFIDFVFFGQTQIRYQNQDELARFLGVFFGAIQLAVLLISTFVSGRLISRYGIKLGLLTLPVIFMASMLLVVGIGTVIGQVGIFFWFVAFAKVCEDTLRWPFEQPSLRVLYTPIPSDRRLASQVAVEGRGNPLGAGFAGVCLLIFIWLRFPTVVPFTYFMVGLFLIWIALVALVYREYITALLQALTRRQLSDVSLSLTDGSSVAILRQGLTSPHVGVVISSLNMLEESDPAVLPTIFTELLGHPTTEIRLDVLQRIERLGIASATPAIRQRIKSEGSAAVRGASLRTLAILGNSEVFDKVYAYLEDPDPQIRRGALVGLLRSGKLEGILAAGEKLLALVKSPEQGEREFVAQVLGEAGLQGGYRHVLQLLRDPSPQVQRAALLAAVKLQHPKLWPVVTECLASPHTRATAAAALVAGGEAVLPELQAAFTKEGQDRELLIRLARICGRIRGPKAITLLQAKRNFPDEQVRSQVLQALSQCQYQAEDGEKANIHQEIKAEIAHATWLLAALIDLGDDEAVQLLKTALDNTLARCRVRLFWLLSSIYEPQSILQAQENLTHAATGMPSDEKRAYALEILDILLSSELKTMLIPLLDDQDPTKCLKRLSSIFPQQKLNRSQRLQELISGESARINPWIRACALYTVAQLAAVELAETVLSALSDPDQLVRETAIWTLFKLDMEIFSTYTEKLVQDPSPQVIRAVEQLKREREGGTIMLSTVEKVMQLKAVSFFSETPEEVLAEVVSILEEQEIQAGETILEKSDIGNAMYMIIDGQVHVHDEERNVTELGENEIFGELSLLDPGPHPASVTALTDVRLLRLDQEPFYELIEDHSTVARKIMQVLARQLRRAQVQVRPGRPTGDVLSEIHEKLTN